MGVPGSLSGSEGGLAVKAIGICLLHCPASLNQLPLAISAKLSALSIESVGSQTPAFVLSLESGQYGVPSFL